MLLKERLDIYIEKDKDTDSENNCCKYNKMQVISQTYSKF